MTEQVVGQGDEQAWVMSGGFFDDAGVEIEKIADDPYGFGNSFHIVGVKECRDPKVTEKGDKVGIWVTFEILEDKYQKVRPFSKWIQLPTPKAIQVASGVTFDIKSNPEDMAVAFNLKHFFRGLGFKVDEMNSANHQTIVGRQLLTRLSAREEDGFWRIGFALGGVRPTPEPGTKEYDAMMEMAAGTGGGLDEFDGGKVPSTKKTAEELLREEMDAS